MIKKVMNPGDPAMYYSGICSLGCFVSKRTRFVCDFLRFSLYCHFYWNHVCGEPTGTKHKRSGQVYLHL